MACVRAQLEITFQSYKLKCIEIVLLARSLARSLAS